MRKLCGVLCATLIALSLSACSTAGMTSSSDPIQTLLTFSVNDLQNADTIAKSSNDTVASTCYEYLIPKVQALQNSEANNQATGAASFLEVSRSVTASITNLKSGLNVNCAALVLDTAATATALGLQIGGLVAHL